MNKMSETLQSLVKAIEARCYGTGMTFRAVELSKNNGTVRYGVQVENSNSSIGEVVYVEDILCLLESGEVDEEEAAEAFENVFIDSWSYENNKVEDFVNKVISGKESILANVKYNLVNREWNAELLSKVPYKEVLDLVAIYEITSENGEFSTKVTYELMKHYGITIQELEEAASKNRREYIIKDIFDVLIDMLSKGRRAEELEKMKRQPGSFDMYVITAKSKIKGASAMLYPENFESLAKELHSDLYIIPCSIHELIVMPTYLEIPPEVITGYIQLINVENVEPEERLSNHVYFYKRGSMQVVM